MSTYIFSDDVQTTLLTSISETATTISVANPTGVYNDPPAPASGQIATLKIVNRIENPSRREIIIYTGRTTISGGFTLTGVVRGQSGSNAQPWEYGCFVVGIINSETITVNEQTTDWNNAVITNFYYSLAGAANAPSADLLTGQVHRASNGDIIQIVRFSNQYTRKVWIRHKYGGGVTWSSWNEESKINFISDWNNATETGTYLGYGAANEPAGTVGFVVGTVVSNRYDYSLALTEISQTVESFNASTRIVWNRRKHSGVWSAWQKIVSLPSGGTAGQGLTKVSGTDYDVQWSSLITASSANTFTNKRITPRITSFTSSSNPAINTDNTDIFKLTAQAVNIGSFTTYLSGTPTDGQSLEISIKVTTPITISWGTSFISSGVALPTNSVSTASNTLRIILQYDTQISKWVCISVA